MPASQHQKPLSDIAIAQAAKKRPIMDIARRHGLEVRCETDRPGARFVIEPETRG